MRNKTSGEKASTLLAKLEKLAAKATPCKNVVVSWYPLKDGTRHPQFENDRGLVVQDKDDYEFYAALRTAWPELRKLLEKLDLREKQLIECQHQLITRNAELFEARSAWHDQTFAAGASVSKEK